MRDKMRPGMSGSDSQPWKHRRRAGATGVRLILNNLAQAAFGAGVGEQWPNFSKKAKRR
jgi:hypothetical protein